VLEKEPLLEELPVLEAKGCPWPPTLQGLPLQSLHRLLRHLVNLRIRTRGPGDPGISPGDLRGVRGERQPHRERQITDDGWPSPSPDWPLHANLPRPTLLRKSCNANTSHRAPLQSFASHHTAVVPLLPVVSLETVIFFTSRQRKGQELW
jgi:hypothetical protein